jgi:hypothetical protein
MEQGARARTDGNKHSRATRTVFTSPAAFAIFSFCVGSSQLRDGTPSPVVASSARTTTTTVPPALPSARSMAANQLKGGSPLGSARGPVMRKRPGAMRDAMNSSAGMQTTLRNAYRPKRRIRALIQPSRARRRFGVDASRNWMAATGTFLFLDHSCARGSGWS